MCRRSIWWSTAAFLLAAAPGPQTARANVPPGQKMAMERPMARFPQAVRVGDLIGRKLIEPSESQGLLGHVVGVARRGETVVILAKVGGLFGRLGGHVVALPTTDVALLGEHVALLGMLPREAAALPRDAGQGALAPDATIELTLVGPFH